MARFGTEFQVCNLTKPDIEPRAKRENPAISDTLKRAKTDTFGQHKKERD